MKFFQNLHNILKGLKIYNKKEKKSKKPIFIYMGASARKMLTRIEINIFCVHLKGLLSKEWRHNEDLSCLADVFTYAEYCIRIEVRKM